MLVWFRTRAAIAFRTMGPLPPFLNVNEYIARLGWRIISPYNFRVCYRTEIPYLLLAEPPLLRKGAAMKKGLLCFKMNIYLHIQDCLKRINFSNLFKAAGNSFVGSEILDSNTRESSHAVDSGMF